MVACHVCSHRSRNLVATRPDTRTDDRTKARRELAQFDECVDQSGQHSGDKPLPTCVGYADGLLPSNEDWHAIGNGDDQRPIKQASDHRIDIAQFCAFANGVVDDTNTGTVDLAHEVPSRDRLRDGVSDDRAVPSQVGWTMRPVVGQIAAW